MAKKKSVKKAIKKPVRLERIVLRTGEALVEAEPAYSAAEPEVVIGELDGPVGFAIANLIGDQSRGHSRVFAILNCDVQVRPVTLMVSKVTVTSTKYTNILMGSVPGIVIGAALTEKVPQDKLRITLGVVLIASGIATVQKGDPLVWPIAAAVAGIGFALILMAPRWYDKFRPKPDSEPVPDST